MYTASILFIGLFFGLILGAVACFRDSSFHASHRAHAKISDLRRRIKALASENRYLRERSLDFTRYIAAAARESLMATARANEAFFASKDGRVMAGLAADLEAARKEIAALRSARIPTLPPESRPPH